MILCGVDEAGRGPVMGPLVMAVYYLDESKLGVLSSLGLKDSKLLSPKRREAFFVKLRELGDTKFAIIMPFKLNDLMNTKTLNVIELEAAVATLEKVYIGNTGSASNIDYNIYIDAFGPEAKLTAEFQRRLSFKAKIFAEHKADMKYPIVSAASIMAKVTRDRIIQRLKKELGDFGSGYPADPRTINFLKRWLREKRSVPPYVRTHWKTYTRLVAETASRSLEDFIE